MKHVVNEIIRLKSLNSNVHRFYAVEMVTKNTVPPYFEHNKNSAQSRVILEINSIQNNQSCEPDVQEETINVFYIPFNLVDPTESCFNETTLGGAGGKGKGEGWWSPSSARLGEATLATGEVGALGDEEAIAIGTNRSLILA